MRRKKTEGKKAMNILNVNMRTSTRKGGIGIGHKIEKGKVTKGVMIGKGGEMDV